MPVIKDPAVMADTTLMKIVASNLEFASSHASMEQRTVSESLHFWSGGSRPDFEGTASGRTTPAAIVSLSQNAQAAPPSSEAQQIEDAADQAMHDPKMQLIISMIEVLTGKKIRLFDARTLHLSAPSQQVPQAAQNAAPAPQQSAPAAQGWGLEYDQHASLHESEQTTFAATGIIKTADGQEIRFKLDLSMSREHSEQTDISVRAGDAARSKDPLVINFSGLAAQLTNTKFAFDIDSDGTRDQISFAGPGSGFLALDQNNDGNINNGSELFGTKSGNGFADLAKYDSDANHWIDANDAVFSRLRVWSKDATGQDTLATLAQLGIGAISLDNTATPFSIKTANNDVLGQVRSSGVYLNENGSVGTLQQIDLAV